jgi:hypothetical protein
MSGTAISLDQAQPQAEARERAVCTQASFRSNLPIVADCICKTLSARTITRGFELRAPSSASDRTPARYFRTSAKSRVLTFTSIWGRLSYRRLRAVHVRHSPDGIVRKSLFFSKPIHGIHVIHAIFTIFIYRARFENRR